MVKVRKLSKEPGPVHTGPSIRLPAHHLTEIISIANGIECESPLPAKGQIPVQCP